MRYSIDTVHSLLAYVTRGVFGAVTHVETQEPVVALTFDDGPHPEFTPPLLDILERRQAYGTFFMIGKAAREHPEIVRRVAEGGHAIGNHSWDHPSFPFISRQERISQIRTCEKVLAPYGQRLFRPPYGHRSLASCLDTLLLGYSVICWNVIGKDWLDYDAEWMADRVINQIKPGSIINFHDALYTTIEERYTHRGPMLRAVALILERASNRFRFVSIPELLRCGRPEKRPWYRAAAADFLNEMKRQNGPAWRYDERNGKAVARKAL